MSEVGRMMGSCGRKIAVAVDVGDEEVESWGVEAVAEVGVGISLVPSVRGVSSC